MIVTVQLEEHDALAGKDPWPLARAILEMIEPGAGGHCVARFHTDARPEVDVTMHYRLGVTIEIVPAPLYPLPHPRSRDGQHGRTQAMSDLIKYSVILDTPYGRGEIEVPTFMGPDAAGRRAVVAAMGQGWGDFDSITVVSVDEIP